MASSEQTYSFVIPIHDEEETLRELHRRLTDLLETLDGPAEVIFVDDGSRDASYRLMVDIHEHDPRFKVARFSRRFGKEVAMTAGLDLADGDAVITMDGDLQHPPEVVPEMIARWHEGYEVVYGVMQQRTESWPRRVTSRLFYRFLGSLTHVDVPPAAGDFRLIDRKALDAFRRMRERNRYVRGMFSWIGYRQIGVPFLCPPRYSGRTKFTPGRLMRFALDGVIGFSTVPLELVLRAGFAISALSFLFGLVSAVVRIAGVYSIPGYATIVVIVSFGVGVQLIVLGVIGEYIARIYDEVKLRPLYLLRDVHGFDAEQLAALEQPRWAVR